MDKNNYLNSYSNSDQDNDEDIRCPICFYYFSEENKPFLMKCNHNICKSCVSSISESNSKCSVCNSVWSNEDIKSSNLNFSFLSIILRILKTKLIFCKKCNKIFEWSSHYKKCSQNNFTNTQQIETEMKQVISECFKNFSLIFKERE